MERDTAQRLLEVAERLGLLPSAEGDDDPSARLERLLADGVLSPATLGDLSREAGLGTPVEVALRERFEVEGLIAEGGAGRVYRARDPRLDRRVAVKVLLSEHPRANERLAREARAQAQLDHPNVCRIFEVGDLGGRPYIAMELVEGGTLANAAAELDLAARLDVLGQVAEGVAAAHARGIVHRDLKPSNVLVTRGPSGWHAWVADFGLAGELSEQRDAGTLDQLGTPQYMAPEQVRGTPSDARTDVYGLGATIHAVFAGRPPFDGKGLEVLEKVLRAEPPPLSGPGLPRGLDAVVQRCLAKEPARRYPTMRALADELGRLRRGEPVLARPAGLLERAWRRARRHHALAGALALAAIGAAAAFVAARRVEEPCRGAEARLAGVWDGPARAAVAAAFRKARGPSAEEDLARVTALLDGYAASWVAMHTESCRATAVRREQSAATLDQRMRCLDRDLGDLRALARVLVQGGAAADGVVAAALRLPAVSECGDVAALASSSSVSPPPAARRAEIDALGERLAEAETYLRLGDVASARRPAGALVAEARRIGYPPEVARALLLEARANLDDDAARAEKLLNEAVALAGEARDDALAARCQLALFALLGLKEQRAEAWALAPLVDAAIRRAGGGDAYWTTYHQTRGRMAMVGGQYPDALAAYQAALAASERADGPGGIDTARIHHNLANVYVRLGRLADAQAEAETARKIFAERLGEGAIDVANLVNTLGALAVARGDRAGARAQFEQALAISVQHHGPRSTVAAMMRTNLGKLAMEEGDLDRAHGELAEALAIREQVQGPDHPEVAVVLYNLGECELRRQRLTEAAPYLERALAVQEKSLPPGHLNLSYTLDRLGDLRHRLGQQAEAAALSERSYAIREKALGADHPTTIETAVGLGELYRDAGRGDDAIRLLTAVEGRLRPELRPHLRAQIRFQLAMTLRAAGREPARALELARRARAEVAGVAGEEALVKELDAWLGR